MPVTSCDMTSIAGVRPTTGTDIEAVLVPSYNPPIRMRSGEMMEAGTWGASTSSDQLGSAKQWTELTTVGTTVSSSPSLCPVNTCMSWPLTVSDVPSTTSLSVRATPFLPSCILTIRIFSSHTTHNGHYATGSSSLGRCHTSEAMTDPHSINDQSSFS